MLANILGHPLGEYCACAHDIYLVMWSWSSKWIPFMELFTPGNRKKLQESGSHEQGGVPSLWHVLQVESCFTDGTE